ncbi:MAG: BatD family protein [Verrucomicrobiales bacterium]
MSHETNNIAGWVLALLAAALIPVHGQSGASVNVVLDPRKITVGEQSTLSIEVTGGQASGLPQTMSASGLSITFMGHNSSVQISSGARTERFAYIYAVVASKPGRYAIPPVEITVAGRKVSTTAQELVVLAPAAGIRIQEDAPSFLRLSVSKTDLYVAEVVPLTLTLYVMGRNTISGVGQPELERENLVVKRFPGNPRMASAEVNGRLYSTLTLETSLFAIADGPMTLGPCTLPASFYEAQGNPRIPSIFRRAIRRNLTSNLVELDIRSLPEDGVPPDFTGAVGSFTTSHTASPSKLKVGDPISVDIEISGIGNFDSLAAPTMVNDEGWQLYPPRELVQNLSDGVTTGKVAYSQVIIPWERQHEIPSFRFSFFDPELGEYITLKTDTIPIEVAPDLARMSGGASSENPGGAAGSPAPAPADAVARPNPVLDDILTINPSLGATSKAATPLLKSTTFWAVQSLPAAAVIALLLLGVRDRVERRALAKRGETIPRSSSETLQQLSSTTHSRQSFYREALLYLERARAEGNLLPPNEDLQRELAAFGATAQTILYSKTADGTGSDVIPTIESEPAIDLLRRLGNAS